MTRGYDPSTLLQRVLVLERQQGFQDRAAVGGLTAFARQQLSRVGTTPPPGLEGAVSALATYSDADRPHRESAIAAALHALLSGSVQPITAPPPSLPDAERSAEPVDIGLLRQRRAERARPSMLPLAEPAPPPPRAVAPSPPPTSSHGSSDLEVPISSIKGIRNQVVDALGKLGVWTIHDLLHYFPRAHYDYADTRSISRMRLGEKITLVGTIESVRVNRTARGSSITTAVVADRTGTVAVRWFNQPYLVKSLPAGARIAISGEPEMNNGYLSFQPRDYEVIKDEDLTHTGRLVPVYPLTRGLFQRSLRQMIRRTVDEYAGAVEDYVPEVVREQLRLPALPRAIQQYHFPDDEPVRQAAQQRLAFDELLLVQLGLLLRKRSWQESFADAAVQTDSELLRQFCESLPFALTQAQSRVINEILRDMTRDIPMNRLLQGDVGSGKTVVAAAALLQVKRHGKQGVLMAPTEILAEQHHRTLDGLLAPFGVRCDLAIGSRSKAKRKPVYAATLAGEIHLLVGTHALIQEDVEFANLGLAITDEQHRFGVEQRAVLRQKGLHPHALAMTATPIPRTLAMTIYGDLDVSALDEMPPGRMPVITTWSRTPAEAHGVIRDEINKGRQAFVICPVIEESADSDMRSVVAEHKELQTLIFPDLQVGLLHGRMRPAEKEAVLQAFRGGEFHILVATSVVEVGIDVPNATVMVIRDAHRFGLAQLHQFRGRVGRGGDQAFCMLLSTAEGEQARERLEALTATENGFELAEEDLRLRGPGEFWGTRQSGLPTLKVATLADLPTVELARQAAIDILQIDPNLQSQSNRPLRAAVDRFWKQAVDLG